MAEPPPLAADVAAALWPAGGPLAARPGRRQPFLTCAVVHGFALAPAMWTPLLARLGMAATTCRVRLPGHGRGRGRPPEPVSFAAVAAHLAHALGRAASRPLHLVGHSMGARLALAMAAAWPGQFASLTLIGVHPGLADGDQRRARARQEGAWRRRLAAEGVAGFMAWWRRLPLFAGEAALSAGRQRALASWRGGHTAAGLCACLDSLGLATMPNFWPAIASLPMPVAFLAGAHDVRYAQMAARAAALAPMAVPGPGLWRPVPGAGHNPALEAPGATASLLAPLLGPGR